MLDLYITFGSTQIDGFGLNSPTYFTFDGGVFVPSWGEAEIEASGRCEGPVRIVDVDPETVAIGMSVKADFVATPSKSGDALGVPRFVPA